jgi:preprotein translocase SecE subunit
MKTYLKETQAELYKVNWPKKNLVTMVTLAVVLISVIVGYLLGAFDALFAKGLLYLLNK